MTTEQLDEQIKNAKYEYKRALDLLRDMTAITIREFEKWGSDSRPFREHRLSTEFERVQAAMTELVTLQRLRRMFSE